MCCLLITTRCNNQQNSWHKAKTAHMNTCGHCSEPSTPACTSANTSGHVDCAHHTLTMTIEGVSPSQRCTADAPTAKRHGVAASKPATWHTRWCPMLILVTNTTTHSLLEQCENDCSRKHTGCTHHTPQTEQLVSTRERNVHCTYCPTEAVKSVKVTSTRDDPPC